MVATVQSQYQPFLLLAARLQAVHAQIQRLRELYLSLRRVVLNDSTDVFARQKDKPGDSLWECLSTDILHQQTFRNIKFLVTDYANCLEMWRFIHSQYHWPE